MNVRAVLREIVGAFAPGGLPGDFSDEQALGSDGLGLDSIAIAEVVLECETRFEHSFAALLDGGSLTIGRLAGHFEAAVAR